MRDRTIKTNFTIGVNQKSLENFERYSHIFTILKDFDGLKSSFCQKKRTAENFKKMVSHSVVDINFERDIFLS